MDNRMEVSDQRVQYLTKKAVELAISVGFSKQHYAVSPRQFQLLVMSLWISQFKERLHVSRVSPIAKTYR